MTNNFRPYVGGNLRKEDVYMRMIQDGVEVRTLPDGACCMIDKEERSPLDLDECPCGYDICSGDCSWYYII